MRYKPRAERLRCEVCPSRNRHVQTIKYKGRRMNLCAECIAALKRIGVQEAKA
jgi:ribosome-binding protein aMBF1 (putative translation factor)